MSRRDTPAARGLELEREVAALYRALGAKVEAEIGLAGNQIDALVTEQSPSGTPVRLAVECKAYTRPVGLDVINSFSALIYLLKQRNLVDKGVVVSTSGFTKAAREAAGHHGIELLNVEDLRHRAQGREREIRDARLEIEEELRHLHVRRVPRVFVVMPFAKDFEDVYILGIREVAEKLDLLVERADSIEHNAGILDVILDRIRRADVVIADATGRNPNVFYEIGYSHACAKATILICRSGDDIPFDLRGFNFILYDTIVDLRHKLEGRLRVTLGG